MKTLEILVIGGPKAGKSSLADAILHHKSQEEGS
jgi:GTPase SAR1 family protein